VNTDACKVLLYSVSVLIEEADMDDTFRLSNVKIFAFKEPVVSDEIFPNIPVIDLLIELTELTVLAVISDDIIKFLPSILFPLSTLPPYTLVLPTTLDELI
jgi:hypothetical protein